MNEANTDLIGQRVEQYLVIKHIARGGMADVYLAKDVDLNRNVALKVMLDALVAIDPQFSERFRREAQVVAQLSQPNIVHVYNVGKTPLGQPYIAMQFIEGGSLQEKLKELAKRKKLLTTEQALNIVRQIALALSAAHKAGIVHRDLKPANVLIRTDGAPVLVDLGIAAIKGGKKLTQTGSVIGTPAYMSPEQVRGVPLDGRSDLYALGVMLYEILAGIPPFEADESIAILHKQVYEEPLPLQSFRPDLKAETLTIVATTLQKDPNRRYQSAEEMISAIDGAIQAEGLYAPNPQATVVLTQMNDSDLLTRSRMVQAPYPSSQTPLPSTTPTDKDNGRFPIPTWAIVLLAILITTSILFFAYRSFGPGQSTPAVVAVDTATPTPTTIPPIEQSPDISQPIIETTDTPEPVIQASDTPQPILEATDTPEPEIIPDTPTDPPTETLTPSPKLNENVIGGGAGLVAYSAQTEQSREIFTFNLITNEVRQITRDDHDDFVPAWSPDGQNIAYISGRNDQYDVFIVDVNSGKTRNLTIHSADDAYPSWSPSGDRIVFHSNRNGDFDIFVIDTDGANLRQLTNNDIPDIAPEWSPDGNKVSFTQTFNNRRQIVLMNPDGSNIQLITSGEDFSRAHPSWSPDGEEFVFYMVPELSLSSGIFVIDKTGQNLRQLTQNTDYEPSWSPDGEWIIFHRKSGDNRTIYRIRPDGTDLTIVINSHPDVREAHWQP